MAKFKKGDKKPEGSGRKKGTKNKLNLGVAETLQERGKDCVDEMLAIAENTDKEEVKLMVYKELLKYVYPQRKAVEMSGDVGGYVVNINNKAVEVERD
jgi:hypothetical protein